MTTPSSMAPLSPTDPARLGIGEGTIIGGRYEVTRLLGAGGMGAVFEARHIAIGRVVAIKVLRAELAQDPTVVTRFVQEARTAAALHHRNIVEVIDFGSDPDGRLYIVMELLRGESLQDLIDREAPLPPARVLALIDPVMRALDMAHERGVIHRDVKPDNIFLAQDDGGEVVPKLLDFGIARQVMDDTRLTRTGISMGTPAYMAPEQAAGERTLTAAVDQYAVGAILYEALTGRVPHEGDTYNAVIIAKATAPPLPLDQLRPDLDAELVSAVMRALARDPGERFASLKDLREALARSGLDEEPTALRALRIPVSKHAATRPDGAPAFHDTMAVMPSEGPPPARATAGGAEPDASSTAITTVTPAGSREPLASVGSRGSIDGLPTLHLASAMRGELPADDTLSNPVSPEARAAAERALNAAVVRAVASKPTEPPPAPVTEDAAPPAGARAVRAAPVAAPSPAPRRRRSTFAALVALTALTAGSFLALLVSRAAHRTPAARPEISAPRGVGGASAVAVPESVTFTFDFTPSHAEILLGSDRVGAGHAAVAVPRDGHTYQLRVTAPGYVPYTEVLTADGNARISHPLLLEDAGAPAVAPPPLRPQPSTPASSGGAHVARPPRPPVGSAHGPLPPADHDGRHPRVQRDNPF